MAAGGGHWQKVMMSTSDFRLVFVPAGGSVAGAIQAIKKGDNQGVKTKGEKGDNIVMPNGQKINTTTYDEVTAKDILKMQVGDSITVGAGVEVYKYTTQNGYQVKSLNGVAEHYPNAKQAAFAANSAAKSSTVSLSDAGKPWLSNKPQSSQPTAYDKVKSIYAFTQPAGYGKTMSKKFTYPGGIVKSRFEFIRDLTDAGGGPWKYDSAKGNWVNPSFPKYEIKVTKAELEFYKLLKSYGG